MRRTSPVRDDPITVGETDLVWADKCRHHGVVDRVDLVGAGAPGSGATLSVADHLAAPIPAPTVPALLLSVVDPPDEVATPGLQSDAVFRLIFDASPVGIGLADENGHFLAVNPSLCRLFGRPAEELLGRTSIEWTHPDDRPGHHAATRLMTTAEDGIARVEKRYLRPDGEVRWAWLTFSHTTGPQGQTWTLAHMQDVTDRIAAEQSLRDSEARLRAVTDVVRSIATNGDLRPDLVRAATGLVGAQAGYLLERDGDELIVTGTTEAHAEHARLAIDPASALARVWNEPALLTLDDEEIRADPMLSGTIAKTRLTSALVAPIELRGSVVALLVVGARDARRSTDLDPGGVVPLLADQTAIVLHQAGLLEELESLATTDELSGLPNRRAWSSRLPELMTATRTSGLTLTVALADLDHFKRFNDAFGHQAGDVLIREFARAARAALPADALLARWGGEEFALAVTAPAGTDPVPVLERIRTAIPGDQTCSVGWAAWDSQESLRRLIDRVDRALYRAKLAGRNRIERG